MKTKLSARTWCALTLFSLIGQVAWVVENMYLNVFIYNMFGATAEHIALMVAASAVSATLTTVLIGALSDKIGRRKLFICGGYILWGISILGFALVRMDLINALFPTVANAATVGVYLVIILDCVMTFFGSSANDAAFNAWLTDSTDSTNRGAAEGINSMMPLVAILAVFGGFMFFDLTLPESWVTVFLIIGGVVIAVGVLGLFLIRDPAITPSKTGYLQNVIYGFRPSTVKNTPALYTFMGLFVLFNISIQIFMPYLIIYYSETLKMDNYVFIMAPAIILASVATALWGKVYDKKGFGFAAAFSLASLSAGYLLLFFFTGTALVFVGSLLMMCGYLSGMAVFGAAIRDNTPAGKSGMLQGVRICSQVLLPGVIGPFIGKTVLANAETVKNSDGTESFLPNRNIFLAALIVILVLVVLLLILQKTKKVRTCRLKTPFEEDPDAADWADEYPRPQMKRDSYLSLVGEWSLSVQKRGRVTPVGQIRVPFPPESPLSGIGRALKKGEEWVYETAFSLPAGFCKDRVLLHFGAVDQVARVSVNGKPVGSHAGGYLPFSFDVTDTLKDGENALTVVVSDPLDHTLPWGKQCRKRGGMWYTPTSGIWQAVWLESVVENAFTSVRFTPTLTSVTVETVGGGTDKELMLHLPDGDRVYRYAGDRFVLEVENPILWTPENPHLYAVTLSDGRDTVDSYFALRTVGVDTRGGRAYLTLNEKPYFFHGLLDQGYYPDGIYLPTSPDGYRFDIDQMKSLGFNMLRKHIKIEPAVFYYECDKRGMAVFQDMVNNGDYHFILDTALPTVGLKKGISHRASRAQKDAFESASLETLDLLYSYPSVCYYTIFNEGWGQYADADRVYDLLKSHDPTRIYDTASGWFRVQKSDVQSEHVYFKKVALDAHDRPLVLSEFGGYSCKLEGHSFNLDKTYGYRFFTDLSAFEDALVALYRDEIIPHAARGMCAAILTQVSDVEDETNGLLTYDRRVLKVSPARMRALSDELYRAFVDGV
ncbi:MAG: MFS transporter [Clostridia bacterium]|nr:MFS transporter [Clostridia bacterium]